MIECFGICSEKCTAMQDGKCVLDAKKAEGANDFQLYKEDEENFLNDIIIVRSVGRRLTGVNNSEMAVEAEG